MKKILFCILLHASFYVNTIGLDFESYHKEDLQIETQRAQEDAFRKKQWEIEDKSATKNRNKEGFWTRLTKKLSSDSATDKEIESNRNSSIRNTNAERIVQDFENKAKRFNDFKKKYPDFAHLPEWKQILQLGDMNKFIKMNYYERTKLINSISEAVEKITDQSYFNRKHLTALTDLAKLTMPRSSAYNASIDQMISQAVDHDLNQLFDEQKTELFNDLKSALKSSINSGLTTLKQFNNQMHNIDIDVKNLDTIRQIKNVGNAAFWICGAAAGVTMLSHGTIAIKGVQITMEKFAIGAKLGLFTGHKSGDIEAEMMKEIQTKIHHIYQKLLPETTKLIDTISYENKAKGIFKRINDSIESKLGTKSKERFNNFKKAISHAKDTTKNGLIIFKNKVQESSGYKKAQQYIKEPIVKVVGNTQRFIAQKLFTPQNNVDISEFDLNNTQTDDTQSDYETDDKNEPISNTKNSSPKYHKA